MTTLQRLASSCDGVIHLIFSFLEDVQDLANCQCVCSRWRNVLHSHPAWTCCCMKTWNLPQSFKALYEGHEARKCCQRWQKCVHKFKGSLFLNHFFACFKTFCGGGEQEAYIAHESIASDKLVQHLRNKQFLTCLKDDEYVSTTSDDEEDNEMRDTTACGTIDRSLLLSLPYVPFENALTGERFNLNEPAKDAQRSLFCHVDVSKLASVNDNSNAIRDENGDYDLQDLSDLWLYSLHNQLRLVDHTKYVQPDATAIVAFITIFFDMLETALLKIEDDEIFLFMLYNALKKVNVFLRVIENKSDFIMELSVQEKWRAMVNQVFECWQALPARHSKLFTRTLKIASSLTREYFANHKPDALVRCFDIFFLLNVNALGGCPNNPEANLLFKQEVYGEPILNAYVAMVSQILKENVHLSTFKSIAAQFDHFYFMFMSLKQEDNLFNKYVISSPMITPTFVRKYQVKILELFMQLHAYLCKCIRTCYDKYDAATMFPSFSTPSTHYANIPQELEISFHGISLCRPGESQKFDKFMHTFNDVLCNIIREIEQFVIPLSKNPAVHRIINKGAALKRKREVEQVESSKRKRT